MRVKAQDGLSAVISEMCWPAMLGASRFLATSCISAGQRVRACPPNRARTKSGLHLHRRTAPPISRSPPGKKTAIHVDPRQTDSTLGANEHQQHHVHSAHRQSKAMMISISASKSDELDGAVRPLDKPALGQCAVFIASTLLMGCQTRGEFRKRTAEKSQSRKMRRRNLALVRA